MARPDTLLALIAVPAFLVHDPVQTCQYRPVSAWMTAITLGAVTLACCTSTPGKDGMNYGIPLAYMYVIDLTIVIVYNGLYSFLFPVPVIVPFFSLRN